MGKSQSKAVGKGTKSQKGQPSLAELKRKAVQRGMLLKDVNLMTAAELQEWVSVQEEQEAAAIKIQAIQRGRMERERLKAMKEKNKANRPPQAKAKQTAPKALAKAAAGTPDKGQPKAVQPQPGKAAAGVFGKAQPKAARPQPGKAATGAPPPPGHVAGQAAAGVTPGARTPPGKPAGQAVAEAQVPQNVAAAKPGIWGATATPTPTETAPPRRRQRPSEAPLRAQSIHATLWRYMVEAEETLCLCSAPEANAALLEFELDPGDIFCVSQELRGSDGVLYLKLADGRGWVPDRCLDEDDKLMRQCWRHKVDEGYVTVSLIIESLSFSRLSYEVKLLADFRTALKEAIAEASGECGVAKEYVGLALWAGSIIVQAIVAPPDKSPESIVAALRSAGLGDVILKKVALVEGIQAAATGPVSVGSVSITSTAVAPPASQPAQSATPQGPNEQRPPPEPPPPLPEEAAPEPPLPRHQPWAPTLRAAAVAASRSYLDVSEEAQRAGRRPALQEVHAEVGARELSVMQATEVLGLRPDEPSALSDAESQESVDSISGEVSRPWGAVNRESRYQYAGRDRALGFSESWRPLTWSRDDWESRLRKAGALKVTEPLPSAAQALDGGLGGALGGHMKLQTAAQGFRRGSQQLAAQEASEQQSEAFGLGLGGALGSHMRLQAAAQGLLPGGEKLAAREAEEAARVAVEQRSEALLGRLGNAFGDAMMLQTASKGFRHGGRELAAREAAETRAQAVEAMEEALKRERGCEPVEIPEFQVAEITQLCQSYGAVASSRQELDHGASSLASSIPRGSPKQPNILHLLDRNFIRRGPHVVPMSAESRDYASISAAIGLQGSPGALPGWPAAAGAAGASGLEAGSQEQPRRVWL